MRTAFAVRVLPILPLAMAVSGCASRPSLWAAGYEPAPGVKAGAARQPPRIEHAVFAALDANPGLLGQEIIGASRARSERLPAGWAAAGSPLEVHGQRVGASLIRTAERYAGNEKRTRPVRVAGPSHAGALGTTGASSRAHGEGVEGVEVEVAVYEYLAVFYREAGR